MNEIAKMDIREVAIGKLKPAAYNPRIDLATGDREFESLRASIEKWNLVEPLVWNERTGNLISGHQRLKICKERGDKKISVVVVNLSDTKERILNLALNRISGAWDYEKLSDVLKEYSYADLGITGLSEGEIDRLTRDANAAVQSTIDQIGENYEPPVDSRKDHNPAPAGPGFIVYLSFAEKTAAEGWLAAHGYDMHFQSGSRYIPITMEEGE